MELQGFRDENLLWHGAVEKTVLQKVNAKTKQAQQSM